jgi:hypothetical protein
VHISLFHEKQPVKQKDPHHKGVLHSLAGKPGRSKGATHRSISSVKWAVGICSEKRLRLREDDLN